MKVQPSARVGVIVFLLYLVVFYGVWIATGIDYEHIGDSATTLFKWYVAPLVAGAVLLVIATTYLGWWGPVLKENVTAPRWTLIPGALMVVGAVLALATKDYSETTSLMLLALVLGSLGVGFCEEVATRGVLLVGLRGSMSESKAWFWATTLFALLHLPNWVFGVGPGALFQVLMAFLAGSTLYLVRRGSGSLVAAMAVHGLWDFSTFIGKGGVPMAFVAPVIGLIGVALVLVLLRARKDDDLAPSTARHAAA